MKILKITIKNFRGIDDLENLEFSDINTFVGKNDSGKSTILRALDCFFDEKKFDQKDIFKGRLDEEKSYIQVSFLPSVEIDDLACDSEKLITIRKQFEPISGKIKSSAFYKCFDFKDKKYQDLWNKKEEDLNVLITEMGLVPEKSGRGKKNIVRISQIKNNLPTSEREDILNPLGDLIKNIEKTYDDIAFPEYSLFDAEQDLSVDATNFQSQFKPIVSAYFETTKTKTEEIEKGLKADLALEFEEIRKFMVKNVSGLKKFNPTAEFDWSKSLKKFDLNLEFEGDIFDVPISHKGTGFKRLLMVAYFEYLANKKGAKNQIFAIEEPETYLHPSAQEDLLNSIIEISANSQFFLTTHSPVFAGATNGDNSILVTKDEKGISHYGKGAEDIIQKIISELGIRPDYSLIKRSKFLVFVEGQDDVLFLRCLAQKLLKKDLIADEIACVIGGGSSLANYADLDLFKHINGAKYAVLVDGDNGDEAKQKEKEKIKTRCDLDNALFYKLSKREIENYCCVDKIKECYISEIKQKEGEQSQNPRIAEVQAMELIIDENTDVEKYLKEQGLSGFKKEMNIKVINEMSEDDWSRLDPINEIKTFIENIYSKL
ncbi:MAG: AAA family ATPase [Leadbetterella sp.]|nr:AAA family ATPase [Leadbetterella sp.]